MQGYENESTNRQVEPGCRFVAGVFCPFFDRAKKSAIGAAAESPAEHSAFAASAGTASWTIIAI
jgi:hypothetical protein